MCLQHINYQLISIYIVYIVYIHLLSLSKSLSIHILSVHIHIPSPSPPPCFEDCFNGPVLQGVQHGDQIVARTV